MMIRYLSANAMYWLVRIIAVPFFVSHYSSSCITIYKPFTCITTEVSKTVVIYGTFSCMSNRGALFVYSSAFCILFNWCYSSTSIHFSINFLFSTTRFRIPWSWIIGFHAYDGSSPRTKLSNYFHRNVFFLHLPETDEVPCTLGLTWGGLT